MRKNNLDNMKSKDHSEFELIKTRIELAEIRSKNKITSDND